LAIAPLSWSLGKPRVNDWSLWPSQLGWAILYLLLYSRACGRARIPLQLDMLSHEARHIEISEMRMSCIPSRLHLPGESFR
ncbi:unnamed protein product, partial [Ectocarpus sp. 12 AP-2014]